jgi:hypothetical protein
MTQKGKGPARKGLADLLVEQGTQAAVRAAKAVMEDRRGQEAVATAVGLAQKGMQRLGGVQEQLLRAVGLPAKADYDEVAKRMARLKRKIRDLSRQVDAGAGARAGGPGVGAHPGADRPAGEGSQGAEPAAEPADPVVEEGGRGPSKSA